MTGVLKGTFSRPMPDGKGGFVRPTGRSFAVNMVTVGLWNKLGVMDEEFLFWDNQTFNQQIGLTWLPRRCRRPAYRGAIALDEPFRPSAAPAPADRLEDLVRAALRMLSDDPAVPRLGLRADLPDRSRHHRRGHRPAAPACPAHGPCSRPAARRRHRGPRCPARCGTPSPDPLSRSHNSPPSSRS
ncbi:hypothetical protein ACRAWF_02500 [Streptomyces sp. L7]